MESLNIREHTAWTEAIQAASTGRNPPWLDAEKIARLFTSCQMAWASRSCSRVALFG